MTNDSANPPSIPPRKKATSGSSGTAKKTTPRKTGSGTSTATKKSAASPASTARKTPAKASAAVSSSPSGPSGGASDAKASTPISTTTPVERPAVPAAPRPTAAPVAGPGAAPEATSAPRPPRPATASSGTGAAGAPIAARKVRLSLSRIDPWSVLKLSFLLSVAVGIMIVIAAAAVWLMIDQMGTFAAADQLIKEVLGAETKVDVLQYVEFSRVLSGATVVAVVDVVLLTALSTLGAFLYNITAALVGGLHVTLTDD